MTATSEAYRIKSKVLKSTFHIFNPFHASGFENSKKKKKKPTIFKFAVSIFSTEFTLDFPEIRFQRF